MTSENLYSAKFPEWYRLERETEKTIKKLSRIEELRFYLRSPDQYYRRLAILRVKELNLKEAISYLEEILDHDAESQMNKKLAAWCIKSICLKWNLEVFISHKLFYQFSGRETYQEMYLINIEDACSSLHIRLPSLSLSSRLGLAENANRLPEEEFSFDTSFSYQEWLKVCLKELKTDGKERFINFFGKMLLKLKTLAKNIKPPAWEKEKRSMFKIQAFIDGLLRKRFDPRAAIGKNLRRILQLVSYPFRLILRNKPCLFMVIAGLYYFLTFTDMGIIFTKDQFGLSFIEMQNNLLKTDLMETRDEIFLTVKKIISIAWIQLKDIADWLYYKWIEEIGVK
ncbi:MAG: hypothetical protein ACOX47_09140 [Bacillota bacterium]|jgi:hypothetical protein